MSTLQLKTAPSSEPVTKAELKKQLELPASPTDHDTYLDRLIQMAREQVVNDTGFDGDQTTYVLYLDAWPAETYITLPRRPVISITNIKYLDTGGTTQTWDSGSYAVDAWRYHPRIWLAYGESWPAIRDIQNAIWITFVAGHTTVADIPEQYKQAVLLRAAAEWCSRNGQDSDKYDHAYDSTISRFGRATYP